MKELREFLIQLMITPGLSGHEAPIRELIAQTWEPLVDEIAVSALGSLHGLRRGRGEGPRPSLLIAAHMDVVGLMVAGVEGEFIRLSAVGGVDARVLPGQPVLIHGRETVPGLVVLPPDRLLPPEVNAKPVPLEHLLVDAGLPVRRLARLVRVGDLISFAQSPLELTGDSVAGPSLDNRASVAALTCGLQELQRRLHDWDVWAVATSQEEITLGGAATSAFQLQPGLAIALDVTYGSGPGSEEHKTFPLDKGPTLGWGPNIHPGLHKRFKELAEQLEIPYQLEVLPRHSGTDAIALQVAARGVPTMVISLPLRYMHTPVEVVSLKDIRRAGRLLAEFISGLEPNFLEQLSWE
jgi:endoglucanase